MFSEATAQIRESLYGIWARTRDGDTMHHSTGTGFMISPGYIVTNAHVLRRRGFDALHSELLAIRSPDVGMNCEATSLLAEDRDRDIAILRIEKPRASRCVTLLDGFASSGTSIGSLGFPLSEVQHKGDSDVYNLIERFQGAYLSSRFSESVSGRQITWYEVDREMYEGSSGCPGYLTDGRVVAVNCKVRREEDEDESVPLEKRRRLEISLWIPSLDVIRFARTHGALR
ncbi:TPA: trypsin-like peptidase domain-containing protein [Candidatus Bathyarchaeota archaeon]|nr:trypsin-like peptidase domain-containing protein [Candidatus Bathyarchaeota archaeon]